MKKIFLIIFCFLLIVFFLSEYRFIKESKAELEKGLKNYNLLTWDNYQPKEISLDDIFNKNRIEFENLDPNKKIEIIVTGDVLLARSVNYKNVSTENFNWPFINVADRLRSADVTYINLESPLVENCPPTNEGMIFCGDPKNVQGLIFAGVDVANIANNHINNYGKKGVVDTIKFLEKGDIMASDALRPAHKTIKGKKITFLGFNDFNLNNNLVKNDEEIRRRIYDQKLNSDILIVQFHWGQEYTTKVAPRQRFLAYLAIDSGADLVIGNHPHWIQPIEIYNGKLIAYSHGNFIFDQEWSKNTKLGIVGKYTFYDDRLIDVEFMPIKIVDYGQPYFLKGEESVAVIEDLIKSSEELKSL